MDCPFCSATFSFRDTCLLMFRDSFNCPKCARPINVTRSSWAGVVLSLGLALYLVFVELLSLAPSYLLCFVGFACNIYDGPLMVVYWVIALIGIVIVPFKVAEYTVTLSKP
jgi:hypothetical protein